MVINVKHFNTLKPPHFFMSLSERVDIISKHGRVLCVASPTNVSDKSAATENFSRPLPQLSCFSLLPNYFHLFHLGAADSQ